MKILIFGGTRFTGPYIVRKLAEDGNEIILFHRKKKNLDFQGNVTEIFGDRHKLFEHKDELKKIKPDLIIDMIALSEKDAVDLIDIFEDSPRVIVVSSADVYKAYGKLIGLHESDLEKTESLSEDSPLRSHFYPYRNKEFNKNSDNIYDYYDKILVEKNIMESKKIKGTIIRYPMVYGPADYQNRFLDFVKPFKDNRPFIILNKKYAEWISAWGYVENMAEAVYKAAVNPKSEGEIYNAGVPKPLSMIELVKIIAETMNWKGEILFADENIDESLKLNMNSDYNLHLNTDKIRKELGFKEVVDLNESIERTVNWQKNNISENICQNRFDYKKENEIYKKIKSLE